MILGAKGPMRKLVIFVGFMTAMVTSIPDGHHTVTPYMSVRGAAEALDFYRQAFAATEVMRLPAPGGKIGHAEIRIGDSRIMLADEFAGMEFLGPHSRGGTTVHIHLYVEDVDATVAQAVAAGGRLKRPVQDNPPPQTKIGAASMSFKGSCHCGKIKYEANGIVSSIRRRAR